MYALEFLCKSEFECNVALSGCVIDVLGFFSVVAVEKVAAMDFDFEIELAEFVAR